MFESKKVTRFAMTGLAVAALAFTTACSTGGGTATEGDGEAVDFPTKEVTMVIPYAAGGPTDIAGRGLASAMEEDLGQTVIVENRPGASGITGLSEIATAKADGYRIVFSTGNSWEQSVLRTTPYTFDDFEPVAGVFTQPYVLVAAKDGKYQTFAELEKAAGAVTHAISGVGTTGHINMSIVFDQLGVKATAVPFDGAGPATQAVVGNNTDVTLIDESVAAPFIESGDMVALAVLNPAGDKRIEFLPDTPTFQELDIEVKDMGFTVWGVAAPAGTPEGVVEILRDAVLAATESADYQAFLKKNHMPLLEGDTEKNWYSIVEENANKSKAALKKFGIVLQ